VFVMMRRDNDPGERNRLLVAGVVYLIASALLIALSIAIYNKTFTNFTTITLVADRAGLQLPKNGDVRYDGVLVGLIRHIDQTGDTARIELGLEPDAASRIPSDVDASILPTTLFGQKYVALVEPKRDGSPSLGLKDGEVIPKERVHTSTELGQVLARLFPLLEAVRPADLSATLAALATALDGRGEQIGKSLVKLDDYLTVMNPHLPTLQEDLELLASVAHTYNVSADDLVTMLGNITVTSGTIVQKKAEFAGLFDDITNVSNLSSEIMADNEVNAVRATHLSVPILSLLDKYSPEYNCLLRGIAVYKPILAKTFEGGQVKQYVEFPTTQHRGYDQRDYPEYNDKRGPACYGLPHDPPSGRWYPWPGLDLRNGTDMDSDRGRGNSYAPPGSGPPGGDAQGQLFGALGGVPVSATSVDPESTPGGRQQTTALLSARTGRPASTIPALSTLLYSPMVPVGGEEG
jgi:phospholipid/cholesterol/gamma-HCH transport system substrate-binding protein